MKVDKPKKLFLIQVDRKELKEDQINFYIST